MTSPVEPDTVSAPQGPRRPVSDEDRSARRAVTVFPLLALYNRHRDKNPATRAVVER